MKEKINAVIDRLFDRPYLGMTIFIIIVFVLHRLCGLIPISIVGMYAIRLVLGIALFVLFSWLRGDRMYSCGLKKSGMKAFIVIIPYIVLCLITVAKTVATSSDISSKLVIGSIIVALEAGVYEEMMVRWFPLGNTLHKKNTFKDMLVFAIFTSVIFGLLHFVNIEGFGSFSTALSQVTNAVAAGFVLAAIYLRTGSIIPGIVAHSLWDFMIFFKPENVINGEFVPIHDMSAAFAETAQDAAQSGLSGEVIGVIIGVVQALLILGLASVEIVYALILLRKSKRNEIVKNFTRD